jgi:hypothetical protein
MNYERNLGDKGYRENGVKDKREEPKTTSSLKRISLGISSSLP